MICGKWKRQAGSGGWVRHCRCGRRRVVSAVILPTTRGGWTGEVYQCDTLHGFLRVKGSYVTVKKSVDRGLVAVGRQVRC